MRPRTAYAAPAWAAEQRLGSVGMKATLLLLANYADENYSCFPGQERIADETEQTSRTIRTHLAILCEVGLIRREARWKEGGGRTSDRYYLNIDLVVGPDAVKAAKDRIEARGKQPATEPPDVEEPVAPASMPEESSALPEGGIPETGDAHTGNSEQGIPEAGFRVTPSGTPSRTPSVGTADAAPDADGALVLDFPASKPTKQPRRIPDDFAVTPAMAEWARGSAPDVDVTFETQQFKDWHAHRGKPGLDWTRAWYTWMRKAQKWAVERRTARRDGRPTGFVTASDADVEALNAQMRAQWGQTQ